MGEDEEIREGVCSRRAVRGCWLTEERQEVNARVEPSHDRAALAGFVLGSLGVLPLARPGGALRLWAAGHVVTEVREG